MWIRAPKPWELPSRRVTPECVYWNRRRFLRALGAGGLAVAGGGARAAFAQEAGAGEEKPAAKAAGDEEGAKSLYPARRNERFGEAALGRELTSEEVATGYNNFYEFSFRHQLVRFLAQRLTIDPWKVEVVGLVRKPRTFDVDELVRLFPLEERLYRLRCVEAWSMAVPWTGFPLRDFVKKMEPLGSAKYLRLVTFLRPDEAPGQKLAEYPWPYFEALRLDEATNELALLATGLYGKPLPKQNGAPIRLVVPWKYGYKSIKSIVRIEFTEERPPTFWNTVLPDEYGFLANVEPTVPHPRWSQAIETVVETGERIPTLPFNGYAEQVAGLYREG